MLCLIFEVIFYSLVLWNTCCNGSYAHCRATTEAPKKIMDDELDENSVCRNFRQTAKVGIRISRSLTVRIDWLWQSIKRR